MKKHLVVVFMAMVAVGFSTMAWAETVVPYAPDMINRMGVGVGSGHNLTSVQNEGNEVIVTITNVRASQVGVDTRGNNLIVPQAVELYSGIMDAAGVKAPFTAANVVNGTVTFRIPNAARRVGVPVVEHIWGRVNRNMALVHDPADPWVCYEYLNASREPDMNTLAIGIVMYPDDRCRFFYDSMGRKLFLLRRHRADPSRILSGWIIPMMADPIFQFFADQPFVRRPQGSSCFQWETFHRR